MNAAKGANLISAIVIIQFIILPSFSFILPIIWFQISRDPEAFLSAHPESLDAENELEMEYNEMLLLAAGNSASSKRNSSKK